MDTGELLGLFKGWECLRAKLFGLSSIMLMKGMGSMF